MFENGGKIEYEKIIVILTFFMLVLTCFTLTVSSKKNTNNLDWLYVGGTGPGNYTKIQNAIDNATCANGIFVYNGTYNESIYINKSISLVGEDKTTTIVISDDIYTIIIDEDYVEISNFTIKNNGLFQFGFYF